MLRARLCSAPWEWGCSSWAVDRRPRLRAIGAPVPGAGSGFSALLARSRIADFSFRLCDVSQGRVRIRGKAGSDSITWILPHVCARHCHGASALALRSQSSSSRPRLKGLHRNLVATRRPPSHHIGVSFQDSGQLCLLSSRMAPPGPLKWNHRRELDFPGPGTCVRCSLISAQAAGPPQPGYGAPPVLGHALLTLVGTETQ